MAIQKSTKFTFMAPPTVDEVILALRRVRAEQGKEGGKKFVVGRSKAGAIGITSVSVTNDGKNIEVYLGEA